MIDEPFDRELAGRLAAYESRLPDAQPPGVDAPLRGGTPRWPLIGVGVLAAAAAVLAVAVLLGGQRGNTGDATPSAVPTPTASAAASDDSAPSASAGPIESTGPTQTAAPTSSPPEPTVELRWSETASFGATEAQTSVLDVVRSDAGLVAVGVAYESQLPILGPTPPHEGRVWVSTDGVAWSDVTPESTFANAEPRHLLLTADGSLIAHGWIDTGDLGERRFAAWESATGAAWDEVETGFPDEAWPASMAQGDQGHVALVVEPDTPTFAVWWSAEGRAWERVHDLGDTAAYWVSAGDEGFVIAGYRNASQEPHTIASGDGRTWFEASTPPDVAAGVVPRGGDWLAVSREVEVVIGAPSTAGVWTSADGLAWEPSGSFVLESRDVNGAACTEWPTALHAAGPWLISATIVSYPCSEGGVETQGTQRISVDGVDWSALPFAPASEEIGLGTRIAGAVEVDGRLVLVGERDRVATFWVGEQP
jgi:hypothetical protein